MTNGEWLRGMSNFEFAEFLNYILDCCSSRGKGTCQDCYFNKSGCNRNDIFGWLNNEATKSVTVDGKNSRQR